MTTLLVIVIILVLVIVFGGYYIIRMFTRYQKGKPINSVLAAVASKWEGSPGSPPITEYCAEFIVNDIVVPVKIPNLEDYNKLAVGSSGILTYRQNIFYKIFVDFEPH